MEPPRPATSSEGRVVAKVLAKRAGRHVLLPPSAPACGTNCGGKKARSAKAFRGGVREQLIKEGNVKIHKKVVEQLAANYRG